MEFVSRESLQRMDCARLNFPRFEVITRPHPYPTRWLSLHKRAFANLLVVPIHRRTQPNASGVLYA